MSRHVCLNTQVAMGTDRNNQAYIAPNNGIRTNPYTWKKLYWKIGNTINVKGKIFMKESRETEKRGQKGKERKAA